MCATTPGYLVSVCVLCARHITRVKVTEPLVGVNAFLLPCET